MKKTFSKFVALLTGVMFLAISCTNASQITFNDLTKTEPTQDGLSTLSIGIGSAKQSRTILPGDWDDTAKSKLVYRLYGKATGATVDLSDDGTPAIFTYSEEKHCLINEDGTNASIRLDPFKWNLLLVAYNKSTAEGAAPNTPDYAQGVLSAKIDNVDLTTGNASIEFDFGTYNKDHAQDFFKDPLDPSNAKGAFDITLRFYESGDAVSTPTTANITITKAAGDPDKVVAVETKVEGDVIENHKDMGTFSTGIGTQKEVHYTNNALDPNTSANKFYKIKVEFKNKYGKVILTYRDKLIIDAGNTSKPTNNYIEIPEGAFNGAPVAPGTLSYKFDFVPVVHASTGNDLDTSALSRDNKVVGQKVVDKRDAKDTPIDLSANKYNVTFTWKDNSVNEEGFILTLETDAGDKITINKGTKKTDNEYVPTISDTNKSNIAIADLNGGEAGLANGDLYPGCESITLTLPMGVGITAADIASTNSFIEKPNEGITAGTNFGKTIGMYTVAYKLGDKAGNIKDSYVYYGNGASFKVQDTASNTYFVKAYEFDTTEELMGQVKWPIIGNARKDLLFSDWSIEDTKTDPAPAETTLEKITKWADLKQKPGADATGDGKLTTSQYNKNIILYPSWLVERGIIVNYPNKWEYRELDVVKNQNLEKMITPVVVNGDKIVDIELPYYENSANETFTVYSPTGGAITIPEGEIIKTTAKNTDTTTGAKLTWNITKWLAADKTRDGGVYSIYVEYDYTGTDTKTLPITGYLYVNVEN